MGLSSNFLPILKSKAHIVFTVDSHVIHQPAPKSGVKFLHQVSLCQRVQKGFNRCLPGFFIGNSGFDFLKPRFCAVEAGGQSVVALLVFRLVKHHMSVFVDTFLNKVWGNLDLFPQFFGFSLRAEVSKAMSSETRSGEMIAPFCRSACLPPRQIIEDKKSSANHHSCKCKFPFFVKKVLAF